MRAASRRAQSASTLFEGPGEMRALCREHDWSKTALGPVKQWSQSLRTTTGLVLGTAFPSIILWGPDLIQIYNDGFIPFLGAKHPEALGAPSFVVFHEVRHLTEPIYRKVLQGETVVQADQHYRIRRRGPDAEPDDVYISFSLSPARDETGDVAGIYIVVFDTTPEVQRRALETERARLASALEAAPAQLLEEVFRQAPSYLAVYRGPEHVFALANDAYYRLVGRERDIIGKPLLEALPELRGQGFDVLLGRVLATGEPFVAREMSVRLQRTRGGPQETRVVNLTYLPLSAPDGKRVGVIAHGTDVTQHVRARRELERMHSVNDAARRAELEVVNQQLREQSIELERRAATLRATTEELARRSIAAEEANRAKSEFLAVMSHELRTPLNAIGGYVQLIDMEIHGPVTTEQHKALRRVQKSTRHLLGLINGVLNFSRVEAGAMHYEITEVALGEVVATCEALVAPQAEEKRITLQFTECAPAVKARADAERIQQILLNLLSNAVKFTGVGGTVTLACARDDDDTAFIRVSDTGTGIDADHLERIFHPFVQVDARLTRAHEGTGLGLAISRDLARAMDGDLTVTSTPGKGSTFTLRLPAA